jgi:hypothetical protein
VAKHSLQADFGRAVSLRRLHDSIWAMPATLRQRTSETRGAITGRRFSRANCTADEDRS